MHVTAGYAERGEVLGIVTLVIRREAQEGVTYERGTGAGWYTQGRVRTDI